MIGLRQEKIDPVGVILLPCPTPDSLARGFTCTGMTFNPADSCWYVGNVGAFHPDEKPKSSIEILSSDFKRVRASIPLYHRFPKMVCVQGLAVDEYASGLYVCSFEEGLVRHISLSGESIDSISIAAPTGVVLDKKRGLLWILTFSNLIALDSTRQIVYEYQMSMPGQDQLAILDDKLYITHGCDYQRSQEVSVFDITKKKIVKSYTVNQSYAIEGIDIVDSLVYIANDGLYHSAKIQKNQVNVYPLERFK
jgi:hypothetical protein